ncbi:hypothetical protein TNCV_4086091 [Trichonephila clavipes]|nr:hypothetical protein TNCV_4086091 [Trichonephila clavipes]
MCTESSAPNGQEIKWAETYRGGLRTRDQRRNWEARDGERYVRRAREYERDWILRESLETPSAREETIVNPRSSADSELWRLGNCPRPL